ncbi:MAG: alpha/beta fold hydrolase [Beijerinckiaceae bacterium]
MHDMGAKAEGAYTRRVISSTRRQDIRGVDYNIREWGDPSAPLLVLLHGHRDASSTFQFVVDLFRHEWRVVCPDWRGFGHTAWAPGGYWYQDYLADLDALLDKLSPDAPVRLAGHSLGGNMSNVYAGVRPERVVRVCSLDGFGLRTRGAEDTPGHLEKFLKAWREPVPSPRPYPNVEAMADRLMQGNKNLTRDKALFLAAHQHIVRDDGSLVWSFDPAHSRPFATLHRVDEWAACWRAIACPALWIGSDRVFPPSMQSDTLSFEWRLEQVKDVTFHRLAGTGHNVHHDAPEKVAELVEDFFAPTR